MHTPFKASRRVAAPFILATASLSLFVLRCSSDQGTQPIGGAGTTAPSTSGASGSVNQGGGSAGMTSGGVTTSGGSVSGTAGTAATAGTASSAGAGTGGGGSGGSAGSSAGAVGTGGSGSPLFAAVKTLMAKSCGVGMCHNKASGELDYQAMDGMLYQRMTQPVPAGTKHCVGSKPIVANDANSLLLQAIKAKGAVCMKAGGGTETIGMMPDECPTKGVACLTAAEQKVFVDWVAAGAPM